MFSECLCSVCFISFHMNLNVTLSHNTGKQHTEQDMRQWLYIAFRVHWFSYWAVHVWALEINQTVMQARGQCAFDP